MRLKQLSGRYFRFCMYVLAVILINVAGLTLFFRADLTSGNVYSLSPVSREVVSTLSEPLTINVFFTKDLPAPYNATERYLRDLLEEYAVYANRYFNYRFYDVSPDEGDITREAGENRALAQNYGIRPVQIQAVEKDEVKFQKAYMGLVLIHGDIVERIPTITTTDGLEYRLTTAIQKLNNKVSALLALEDKIRVTLVLSSSLEAVAPYMRLEGLSDLPRKLEEVVDRLNRKTYGKLDFEYLDPGRDPGLEEFAERHHLLSLSWPALAEGRIPAGRGTAGLVMSYGDKAVTIPVMNVLRLPLIGTRYELVDLETLEKRLGDNLESLIDVHQKLGYLADQGTFDVAARPCGPAGGGQPAEIAHFPTLVSETYTLEQVALKDGPIPESFECLVIARPMEAFSEYELFLIDQYLMRGNSLALFLDAFKEEAPPGDRRFQMPRYTPLETGLEKLLEHYGIRIGRSYVLDEHCFEQTIPARLGGGRRPIYFAPEILNRNINHDLKMMKNIKGLVAYKISPLELDAERAAQNGIRAHRLFSSSEKSWEMKGNIQLNPMFIRPPSATAERRRMPLAYLLEGEFPSYFAGKAIPERKDEPEAAGEGSESPPAEDVSGKEAASEEADADLSKIKGERTFLPKGKPGRIFVMASSAMLEDNLLDPEGRTPNATFVLNVIDTLNDREGIAVMRSKVQRLNPLREADAGVRTFVKSFNIAGLPLIVVMFGLLAWSRRRLRRKRIQQLFQK